jgi:hypothetical protein
VLVSGPEPQPRQRLRRRLVPAENDHLFERGVQPATGDPDQDLPDLGSDRSDRIHLENDAGGVAAPRDESD